MSELIAYLKSQGLSQAQIDAFIQSNPTVVSQWESLGGRPNPSGQSSDWTVGSYQGLPVLTPDSLNGMGKIAYRQADTKAGLEGVREGPNGQPADDFWAIAMGQQTPGYSQQWEIDMQDYNEDQQDARDMVSQLLGFQGQPIRDQQDYIGGFGLPTTGMQGSDYGGSVSEIYDLLQQGATGDKLSGAVRDHQLVFGPDGKVEGFTSGITPQFGDTAQSLDDLVAAAQWYESRGMPVPGELQNAIGLAQIGRNQETKDARQGYNEAGVPYGTSGTIFNPDGTTNDDFSIFQTGGGFWPWQSPTEGGGQSGTGWTPPYVPTYNTPPPNNAPQFQTVSAQPQSKKLMETEGPQRPDESGGVNTVTNDNPANNAPFWWNPAWGVWYPGKVGPNGETGPGNPGWENSGGQTPNPGTGSGIDWTGLLGGVLAGILGGNKGSTSSQSTSVSNSDSNSNSNSSVGPVTTSGGSVGDITTDISDLIGSVAGGSVGNLSTGPSTSSIGDFNFGGMLSGLFGDEFGKTVIDFGASEYASNQYKKAADDQLDFQRHVYEEGVDRLEPYNRKMGLNNMDALNAEAHSNPALRDIMSRMLDIDPNTNVELSRQALPTMAAGDRGVSVPEAMRTEVNQFDPLNFDDPFYQRQKEELMDFIEGSAAAKGMLYSGDTLEELQDRGSDLIAGQAERMQNIHQNRDRMQLGADQQYFGQQYDAGGFADRLNRQDLVDAVNIRKTLFGEDTTAADFDLTQANQNISNQFGRNDQLFKQLFDLDSRDINFDKHKFGKLGTLVGDIGFPAAAGQVKAGSSFNSTIMPLLSNNTAQAYGQGMKRAGTWGDWLGGIFS